jgi:hypothetical protein
MMVGCVGNAPTLVRKDIRFTGGSRSLRGYQPILKTGDRPAFVGLQVNAPIGAPYDQ